MSRQATLSILGMYDYNPDIFDTFRVPETIDKQILIDKICIECAEMELLFPHPTILKRAIEIWSNSLLPNWERINRAMTEEYNPIHNYDRYEEWKDKGKGNASNVAKNAGYNLADDTALASEGVSESDTETEHNGHLYGNIGVTSSMAMVKEEIELRKNNNIYDIICNDFKNRFCLLIY